MTDAHLEIEAALDQRQNGASPPESKWPAPLAPEAFYGLAGEVVSRIEPYSEADASALLLTFLAAFGNAVKRGPHILAGDAEHGPNLFALIVGETGIGRKGTSWQAIRRVMRVAAPDWMPTGGVASGEGIIHHVRDPRDVRRRARSASERAQADGEGMITVREDDGVEDKRLFLVETEFARLLSVAERRDSTTSAVLRQLWDSGDSRSLAKNSHERTTGAHVTLVGHITPDELKSRLTDTEVANGFTNRLLIGLSKRSKLLPDGDSVPDEIVRDLGERIAEAFPVARCVTRADLDSDARALWRERYERLSTPPMGMIGAVIARACAHVLRLALIYALTDSRPVITIDHLRAALATWEYCEESARYLFGESTGNQIADRILHMLRAQPAGLTRTDISDRLDHNQPAARIDEALAALLVRGLVKYEWEETGGRPAQRWHSSRNSHDQTGGPHE